MLPKRFRFSSKFEFRRVKKFGRSVPGRLVSAAYYLPASGLFDGEPKSPTFGFIVSKRISKKATRRNLIKRRLGGAVWEFLRGTRIGGRGARTILIARPPILESDYGEIALEVNQVLSKIFKF